MKKVRIGVISDLHLFRKSAKLERAFSKLQEAEILLTVGDIADRGDGKQYKIFLKTLSEALPEIPVYSVSGNHDNPARNDTVYRRFEERLNGEYPAIVDACGAFCRRIHGQIEIIGLNPTYHQKQFFFPDRGRQIDFLETRLRESPCRYRIVMCHPPLIAHNPQRSVGASTYITPEQDARLQGVIDGSTHTLFLSGHTHALPSVESDASRGNLYINVGSLCPTSAGRGRGREQEGNVILLEFGAENVSVTVRGIDGEGAFVSEFG